MMNDAQNVTGSEGSPLILPRIALGLCAMALFVLALTGAVSPAALSRVECWWLMIASVAVLAISVTLRTPWQLAGLAAALFVAGLGAQLAIRSPVWFQHVRFSPPLFAYSMLAVIAAQGAATALVWWRHRLVGHVIRACSDLGWVRVVLFLLVMVAASKGVMDFIASETYPRLVKHVIIGSLFAGLNLASFVAILAAMPADRLTGLSTRLAKSLSLPGSGDEIRRFDRAFPYCLAIGLFLISTLISLAAFRGVPHLDDILYVFHARYLADGLVTLPIPPSTDAFDHYLMDSYQDRWFVTTFPGWPVLLAFGLQIGMPWIVNPLLAAISVLLLHRFMRVLTDRGTANLAALLMAISPWYISMAATQLIHTFTYALILGAWVLLLKARERPSVLLPFIAGALLGWLVMTRPLEGFYMGVLTGLWTLSFLKDKRHWQTVIAFGLGCIAVGGLIFPYVIHLTGDAFSTPLNTYYDKFWGPGSNALGFGPDIGAPDWGNVDVFKGHSPLEALINAQQNLYELNFSLFGWGGTSLAFALFFVLWGQWTRLTAAMAVIIVVTAGFYALFWFYGGFFAGPRYWFMMIVPLLILTAFGVVSAVQRLTRIYPAALVAQRIGGGIVLLCLCSVLVFESWLGFNRYPGINGYHAEYQDLARQEQYRNSLMFISTDVDKEFGSAFWLNDFSATSDSPLFARDLGPESNRDIAAAYPDRVIFFVDGRSSTRDRVVVISGPVSLADLE
ncbi:hypothetical protein GS636_20670 [Ruegeria sp. HKCCD4884]|uniref:glycosyltransferase family 39 protein n=1 Tax=Ruegeria sp. HKCCD4884 TaxID=2683022 RepID=UPI0014914BFF|nr:glycosyltransferase family 39 protein [Ruegeria sp. HKCCD4884]NOD95218.1 hypothetical protein [Ruegeria sp. HKCCD4884]